MFLDYSLKTPEERNQHIKEILKDIPPQKLTSTYLNNITNYLLFVTEKDTTKQQKKEEYPIETTNRAVTIDKRQVSLEQIISSLETGEDKIYNLINNDKNQFLDPREKITPEDRSNPVLQPLFDNIETYKRQLQSATGKRKFALKSQIIETYQEIYAIKSSQLNGTKIKFSSDSSFEIPEHITFDDDGIPHSDAPITLLRADHISLLLKYYESLKIQLNGQFFSDLYWILQDLDRLINQVLRPHPILFDLLSWKTQKYTNEEINTMMKQKYNVTHTDQYWSTLWKQRIPKMLATQAQENYILWYHTNVVRSEWKKCSKCGEVKLAHPFYFSRNGSKNKYYSICKKCRTKKANKDASEYSDTE